MSSTFIPANGWGPASRRGALSITFDNLGEAAEIEAGMWGDKPVGKHFTADFIPRLIDRLGDVRATYFVEASNVALYPDVLKQWYGEGHEIGLHAWRHEIWDQCEPARRRQILHLSLQAMRSLDIEPVGFRPPGGAIPAQAWEEFQDAGLLYCSDLGEPGARRVGNMIALPFEWHGVDAYMIEELMSSMRKRHGEPEEPPGIEEWRATLQREIEVLRTKGGHRAVVFHPQFLAGSEAKFDVLSDLIDQAKGADLWIATAGDVARFVAGELAITA